MPREFINDEMDPDSRRTIISWGREHPYVQLGVEFPGETFSFDSALARDRGTPPVPGSEPEKFSALFVQLDRNGCNRLIRFLRRARDQAFGVDE